MNINSHTCTCRRWDDLQVPCIHACKAILARGENVVKYTGLTFHTSSMIQAYSGRFLPVIRQDLLPEPNRKAPKYTTQPDRPQKRRVPSKGSKEAVVRSKHGKSVKTRAPAKCSSCGGAEHHYAPTCRGTKQANPT